MARDEPQYVPVGDEFEDDQWRIPVSDFEIKFLKVVGRKYYDTKVNQKRVLAIEKKMNTTPPKYPALYIDKTLEWAIGKNTPRVKIRLKALISAVRNPDNLSRFYEQNPQEVRNFDTKTDFDW